MITLKARSPKDTGKLQSGATPLPSRTWERALDDTHLGKRRHVSLPRSLGTVAALAPEAGALAMASALMLPHLIL